VVSKIYLATDSSPVDMQSYELCADMIDVITDVSSIYGGEDAEDQAPAPGAAPGATSTSNCVISLNNGTVLILREVNRSLALVCILKAHALAQQARLVCPAVSTSENQ
jgi:Ras-related GTP-binding protein C/D